MDRNYEQITGEYMSGVLPDLLNKKMERMESPMIIEADYQLINSELDSVLENYSSLYLKGKTVKRSIKILDDSLNISSPNLN